MVTATAAPVAERVPRTIPPRRFSPRPCVFWDPRTGNSWSQGLESDSAAGCLTFTSPGALGAYIAAHVPSAARRLYITGPRPGDGSVQSMREWFTGWLATDTEWESEWRDDDRSPVLILKHRTIPHRRLEVRRVYEWFGESSMPRDCAHAMHVLGTLLRDSFGPHAMPLASPSMTGLDTWDRTQQFDVPALPDDVRQLVRDTAGQARVQLCPAVDQLPGLVYMDARFAYAALAWGHSGTSTVTHDNSGEFADYQPARYRIHFAVPAGWSHVGLFGVRVPAGDGGGWVWPDQPGYIGETWADGSEVMLARRRGWFVSIQERVIFGSDDGYRPLESWGNKLLRLRERVAADVAAGALSDVVGDLVLDALRAIILHGIGGFARGDRRAVLLVREGERLPKGITSRDIITEREQGGVWAVTVRRPLSAWSARFSQPQWAAAIWARQRCRNLSGPGGSGVLNVPRRNVVAIQADALYLTENPRWPDDGKPGRFRAKGYLDHATRAPRSWADLYEMRGRMTPVTTER